MTFQSSKPCTGSDDVGLIQSNKAPQRIPCYDPKGSRAFLRILSTDGRGVGLCREETKHKGPECWAFSKPKGPEGRSNKIRFPRCRLGPFAKMKKLPFWSILVNAFSRRYLNSPARRRKPASPQNKKLPVWMGKSVGNSDVEGNSDGW